MAETSSVGSLQFSKSNELVSVIIPTYRRPQLLAQAIESVLNQTYPRQELIVVDDGSEDETPSVVRQYSRARYLHQTNHGPSHARNTGLAASTGEYVASLDHDDRWDPGYLERAIDTLTVTQSDLVWLNYRQEGRTSLANYMRSSPPWLARLNSAGSGTLPFVLEDHQARELFFCHGPASNSAIVYRRKVIGSGWVPQTQIADDWLLLASIMHRQKIRAAVVPEVSWTKNADTGNYSRWSEATFRRLTDDYRFGLEAFGTAFLPGQRKMVRRKIATLQGDFVYSIRDAGPLRAILYWGGACIRGDASFKNFRLVGAAVGRYLLASACRALRT